MKTTIKTCLAVVLLLAVSCKKESNTIQSSDAANKSSTSSITDITANYPSIKIGTQKWMTKNLDVTKYRNGDKIPQVKKASEWAALTTGAWCWYKNDSDTGAVYGKLYNWYAVHDPRGLAPTGWHVPSDAEWTTLSTFLGGEGAAGGKMKETGTTHWLPPNAGATNESGFTGLPGGNRHSDDGAFHDLRYYGYLWSSTEDGTTLAWSRYLGYSFGLVFRSYNYKKDGFSVRCIKD